MTNKKSGAYVGINLLWDPSVAIVQKGKIIAYSEEERHVRFKHAPNLYPRRALDYCLKEAGVSFADVEAIGINWDIEAYSDGRMQEFNESLRQEYPVVSFHRPCEKMLGYEGPFAGRLHTYQPLYFKEACYVSDSRGGWFHGHPFDRPAFSQGGGMQFLTHAIWWDSERTETSMQRLDRFVRDENLKLEQSLADHCKPYKGYLRTS